jgi:hypothetical protein
MESLPLWVWALIIGLIISSKFICRWKATEGLVKKAKQSEYSFKRIRRNWVIINNRGITDHKYDPQKYSPNRFKDYHAMRKNNSQKLE